MSEFDMKAYQAAWHGAAYRPVPQPGLVRISGEDRKDFIQRQTTNDVGILAENRGLLTSLTTPMGRILDVWYLLQAPDTIELITLPGRSGATSAYLRSRIFFMDKVAVEDLSNTQVQLDLFGPQSGDALLETGFPQIPSSDQIVRHGGREAEWIAWSTEPGFCPGYRILAPTQEANELFTALEDAGAVRLGEEEYTAVRVELGLPAEKHELTEEYTPLEVGLMASVSDRKGCYTGQEVLARQINYDKVSQRMVGLKLVAPADPRTRIYSLEEKPIGELTSCVKSPRFGLIGLAVLKRPYNQAETLVLQDVQKKLQAQVCALPF